MAMASRLFFYKQNNIVLYDFKKNFLLDWAGSRPTSKFRKKAEL